MKELSGFTEGGSITYSINGKDHTYHIGGTILEMQYGNYGIGLIGGYFPKEIYEEFAGKYSNNTVTEYFIKTTESADLSIIKNVISEMIKKKGLPY